MPSLIQKDDGTQRVNIYQSDLVRLGSMSVQVKSDAMKSKYAKGSADHYCYLDLGDGSDKDYCLAVEPEVIAAINAAPKGEWLHMTATGGRDQPPTLKFASRAQPEPNPELDGPPPMWPEEAAPAHPPYQPSPQKPNAVDSVVADTLRAVKGLEVGGVRVDSDAAARIFSTIYIQAYR